MYVRYLLILLSWCLISCKVFAGQDLAATVDWSHSVAVSKTQLSIQVCPEPPMRPGTNLHDPLYSALRDLKVDLARLQPWFPYPQLSVAELEPPKDGRTAWDFKLIDPIVEDFFKAAEGRPVMVNFGTIPQWMWKTEGRVPYPADPNEITWNYKGGRELRDPSFKEVVDYFHRLASWYIKGGFTDEFGRRHESGHHFKIDYWEVLNEINIEHDISPELYTRIYDAVVADLHQLDPTMKFSGLALAGSYGVPETYDYFEYFLNPKNHKPGIPIDMFSYHFYTNPNSDETQDIQQHTIFDEADQFYIAVEHIEAIHRHLAPATKSYINELGSFSPNPLAPDPKLPPSFWNLSGSMFAFLYPKLVGQGIDYVAAAELIDYPEQYPATTLVDWESGKPNARYWVAKLLRDNFGPGDKLVESHSSSDLFMVQGFLTGHGERKVLLVNKRNAEVKFTLTGARGSRMDYVDQFTGWNPPVSTTVSSETITLAPQRVAVVTLAR